MTQAPLTHSLIEEASSSRLMDFLNHSVTRVAFLSFMVWLVFFPEHNFDIVIAENFVQDIEDQEKWADGGNYTRRFAFLSAAAVGMISFILGRGQTFRFNLPVFLIATYVLWAGASIRWSIDSPATIRRYTIVLCCVIGCFGYCRFMKVKEVVLAAVIVTLAFLVFGVGTEIFFGKFAPYKGAYRFAGTVHPNIQGATLAMGCIAAYTMTRVQPKFKTLFFSIAGLLFVFLVLTKCRSATLCVPVCIGVMWLSAQSTQKIVIGSFLTFWFLGFVILFVQVTGFDPIAEFEEILLLGRKEETGESLTGRLPLWEDLWTYIGKRPFQGFGYGAFWTPRHINEIAGSQQWVISEAHSSYFDTMLQLGIVGCFLVAVTAVTTFFYSAITFRRTWQPEYLFLVGGAFFCIVRGFTESRVNDPASVSTFLFLAIAAHSWNTPQKMIDTNTEANNDIDPVPETTNPPNIS